MPPLFLQLIIFGLISTILCGSLVLSDWAICAYCRLDAWYPYWFTPNHSECMQSILITAVIDWSNRSMLVSMTKWWWWWPENIRTTFSVCQHSFPSDQSWIIIFSHQSSWLRQIQSLESVAQIHGKQSLSSRALQACSRLWTPFSASKNF